MGWLAFQMQYGGVRLLPILFHLGAVCGCEASPLDDLRANSQPQRSRSRHTDCWGLRGPSRAFRSTAPGPSGLPVGPFNEAPSVLWFPLTSDGNLRLRWASVQGDHSNLRPTYAKHPLENPAAGGNPRSQSPIATQSPIASPSHAFMERSTGNTATPPRQ